jgi:hypothetical protein
MSCPVPVFIGAAPLVPVPHHFVQSTGPLPEFSEIATVTHLGGFSLPSWPPLWLALLLALWLALGLPLEHPVKIAAAAVPAPPTIMPAATAATRFLFIAMLLPLPATADTGTSEYHRADHALDVHADPRGSWAGGP